MQTVTAPGNFNLTENQWWFIFNDASKLVIVKPRQGVGKISSPHTLVICDTKEDCESFITENNLT
jgi:hypothetical protein